MSADRSIVAGGLGGAAEGLNTGTGVGWDTPVLQGQLQSALGGAERSSYADLQERVAGEPNIQQPSTSPAALPSDGDPPRSQGSVMQPLAHANPLTKLRRMSSSQRLEYEELRSGPSDASLRHLSQQQSEASSEGAERRHGRQQQLQQTLHQDPQLRQNRALGRLSRESLQSSLQGSMRPGSASLARSSTNNTHIPDQAQDINIQDAASTATSTTPPAAILPLEPASSIVPAAPSARRNTQAGLSHAAGAQYVVTPTLMEVIRGVLHMHLPSPTQIQIPRKYWNIIAALHGLSEIAANRRHTELTQQPATHYAFLANLKAGHIMWLLEGVEMLVDGIYDELAGCAITQTEAVAAAQSQVLEAMGVGFESVRVAVTTQGALNTEATSASEVAVKDAFRLDLQSLWEALVAAREQDMATAVETATTASTATGVVQLRIDTLQGSMDAAHAQSTVTATANAVTAAQATEATHVLLESMAGGLVMQHADAQAATAASAVASNATLLSLQSVADATALAHGTATATAAAVAALSVTLQTLVIASALRADAQVALTTSAITAATAAGETSAATAAAVEGLKVTMLSLQAAADVRAAAQLVPLAAASAAAVAAGEHAATVAGLMAYFPQLLSAFEAQGVTMAAQSESIEELKSMQLHMLECMQASTMGPWSRDPSGNDGWGGDAESPRDRAQPAKANMPMGRQDLHRDQQPLGLKSSAPPLYSHTQYPLPGYEEGGQLGAGVFPNRQIDGVPPPNFMNSQHTIYGQQRPQLTANIPPPPPARLPPQQPANQQGFRRASVDEGAMMGQNPAPAGGQRGAQPPPNSFFLPARGRSEPDDDIQQQGGGTGGPGGGAMGGYTFTHSAAAHQPENRQNTNAAGGAGWGRGAAGGGIESRHSAPAGGGGGPSQSKHDASQRKIRMNAAAAKEQKE